LATASKSPSEAAGNPGLDDVDAQFFQLGGQAQLFAGVHAGAGRLLAVSQGGIENDDAFVIVFFMGCSWGSDPP
jgi:hypothetical protein